MDRDQIDTSKDWLCLLSRVKAGGSGHPVRRGSRAHCDHTEWKEVQRPELSSKNREKKL